MARLLDLLTALALVAILIIGAVLARDRLTARARTADRLVDNWAELTSSGHRVGPDDAKAVMIEFVDYECAACRNIAPAMKRVSELFSQDLAIIYRHWPLDSHPAAFPAALAAECAAEQGHFSSLHDLLLTRTAWMRTLSFLELANEAGVPDVADFGRCIEEQRFAATVAEHANAAIAFGARGTPAFLLEGVYLRQPTSEEEFIRRVSEVLERN
jgi:protein-disulfide isomerase